MKRIAVVFLLAVGVLLGRSAFGVSQLIIDGNFTSISPLLYWNEGGNSQTGINFFPPNGAYLSMGNANGPIVQEVFQTVTVPTNTILLQVSYFWQMSDTNDPTSSAELSSFVADSNDVPLAGGGIDNEFNQQTTTTGFRQVTVDSTNLAGQTVDLAFEVQLFDSNEGLTTAFNIANVSMLAFTTNDIPPNDYFTNATVLNTSSNISVLGTNILATKEAGETNIAGNVGGHSLWWKWTAPSNGFVRITTAGSIFNTLLGVYTGTVVSNLTPVAANDSGGTDSSVKFIATAGTTYDIGVDGKNGATGVAELNLSFSLDTKPPTVAITSPASNAKLTNSTVVVKGTASDSIAVASVQYRLENAQVTNDFQAAVGTNDWTFTITNLIPGPNTIQVFSVNTSGNQSVTNSRTVTYDVVSPLTVNVSGTGTFSPNLSGDLEDVGTTLTLTARPGAGEVFSNWEGPDGVLATTAALTFTMQSNLVLTANFVPNPFGPVVGTYQGLFYDSNDLEHASSGFFNVTLAGTGSYSAKVMVAGLPYSLSGEFSAGGVATNNIVRRGSTPVSVQMQLDLSSNDITGVLSDGTWVAQLSADRVVTSATAAHYTMMVSGVSGDSVGQPAGDGYGTLTVSSTGGISFSGALQDGTKITQKANLLPNGQWAFYAPLYSGKGSIFGWLTFTNELASDLGGTVEWTKPAGAGKLYPLGFTNETEVAGSLYQFTNNVPVLSLTDNNAWFHFLNGDLASGFTNQFTLSTANKITSTNKLTAAITTSSGLFKVTAVDPATGKSITGNGVVIQKANFGAGFFLGTNETGTIILTPVSP